MSMFMTASDELLLRICRCEEISRAETNHEHPCHEIVNTQDPQWDGFQLPEPWSGDLKNAKLLFIASNPSINSEESYPNRVWPDEVILDFFSNRFNPESNWTNNRKVLLTDGENYAKRSVAFWNSVNLQSERAFGRKVLMGVDCAMTEVVHCKSKDEDGVEKCLSHCSNKWMDEILSFSEARVLILLGNQASSWFESTVAPLEEFGVQGTFRLGGKERLVIHIPHPASWAKVKRLDKILSEDELARTQKILNY